MGVRGGCPDQSQCLDPLKAKSFRAFYFPSRILPNPSDHSEFEFGKGVYPYHTRPLDPKFCQGSQLPMSLISLFFAMLDFFKVRNFIILKLVIAMV